MSILWYSEAMGRNNFTRLTYYFVLAFIIVFFFVPKIGFAQEQIQSFRTRIQVEQNASLKVKETIVYDFGNAQKHGIYRDIPYKYKARGGNYNLRLTNFSVTDAKGNPWPFVVSNQGKSKRIKIGNVDTFVSGKKTYIISYTVSRAINYFGGYDELYWNSTGNGWQVPILQSESEIILPGPVVDEQELKVACFAGSLGSSQACSSKTVQNSTSVKFSQNQLSAFQGLTIVVGFPKGLVRQPTFWENFLETARDNWVLVLPFLTLIFLFYWWRSRGRDPSVATIVPQYEALDNLSPIEIGTIVDEKADNQDVSAEIIYLATQGYIKITRLEKNILFFNTVDYQLDLIKDPPEFKEEFKNILVKGLFKDGKKSVKFSDLKTNFFESLKDIKDEVYKSVTQKGYFLENPQRTRRNYFASGLLIIVIGIILGAGVNQLFLALGLALSGLLFLAFSFFMPVKTKKGAEGKAHILGLKMYLSVAEKERLKFHNAPEKNPERFEKFLPYAIALRVEKQWAKQFEGIYVNPPSWYEGGYRGGFSAVILASSLNSFSQSANANMAARSSGNSGAWGGGSGFSGGGFSGGGFGGGGGGSW